MLVKGKKLAVPFLYEDSPSLGLCVLAALGYVSAHRDQVTGVNFAVAVENDFVTNNINAEVPEAYKVRVEVVVDLVFSLDVESHPVGEGSPKRFFVHHNTKESNQILLLRVLGQDVESQPPFFSQPAA